MEEFVGKVWHRYISNRVKISHPHAKVTLDHIRPQLAIFFRALGCNGALQINEALTKENKARRRLLQRIAGTGRTSDLAYLEHDTLRLPPSISIFPSQQLNRDLYTWLTAISVSNPASLFWLQGNQQRTAQTLNHWPGLNNLYQRLVIAHLKQRPSSSQLSPAEAGQERTIRLALINPESNLSFSVAAKYPPQPVILWLHPTPPNSSVTNILSPTTNPDSPHTSSAKKNLVQQRKKKAERSEMPDNKNGLMSFRLESLWSWTEYIKVDRAGTEDDNDDAARTAQDMEKLTVAQDGETASHKIKLDLDLPSSQYDDIVIGEGIPVDEWDYKAQRILKDHCRLIPMVSRHNATNEFPKRLQNQARKIRRHFELLRPERHWVNRQSEGSELDLENYIHAICDRKRGQLNSDTPIYQQLQNQHRDLSCLLLADLSLSTDAHITDEVRIIDIIRDALYLFSEALYGAGDDFALHGFSSRNRNHIRFYDIKPFSAPYNELTHRRINAIKPGYYTRMGTAIRHASDLLDQTDSRQKLLLILSDGKPNDLDKYEGRYGIEDTRMAILEAKKRGLRPFCVTIDEQAEDYLPYIYGKQSSLLIRNAKELPSKLPLLYLHLTR